MTDDKKNNTHSVATVASAIGLIFTAAAIFLSAMFGN